MKRETLEEKHAPCTTLAFSLLLFFVVYFLFFFFSFFSPYLAIMHNNVRHACACHIDDQPRSAILLVSFRSSTPMNCAYRRAKRQERASVRVSSNAMRIRSDGQAASRLLIASKNSCRTTKRKKAAFARVSEKETITERGIPMRNSPTNARESREHAGFFFQQRNIASRSTVILSCVALFLAHLNHQNRHRRSVRQRTITRQHRRRRPNPRRLVRTFA